MSFILRIGFGVVFACWFLAQSAFAVNVSSFSPGFGAPGDFITIRGSGFYPGVLAVYFGAARDYSAQATSADGTVIIATVPAGATTGPITVMVDTVGNAGSSLEDFTVIGPGPYVSGFSPAVGSGGTLVLVDGAHFSVGTGLQVTFNGVLGTGVFAQSDTRLQVNAPAGVTTGPIRVSSSLGSSLSSSNFFAPPTITGFSPASGRAGTNLVVTGTNLRGTLGVTINSLNVPSFTVLSNGAISVVVPPNATTGKIRVNTPAGSTITAGNFALLPTISGFSPAFGAVGTGVQINGANLNVGSPVVYFNGVQAAAPSGVTFGQINVVVPAGATTGPITVTTADGSHSSAALFYLPPTISSISPDHGAAGTIIKITGANLVGCTAVSFNGLAAPSFWVTNATTIGAVVPAGLATGPLSVTTPGGTATSGGLGGNSGILFYGAPLISGFSPSSGLPGTNVTLSGSNFIGATSVRFGGLPAVFAVVDNNQLTTTVPLNAQTAPITVIGPGGTNVSAANFLVNYPPNYRSDLSVVPSASPDPVTVGSNLLYTLVVNNRGPYASPNVRLTSRLDSTVIFKSANTTQGTWGYTNGVFSASPNSIDPGQSVTLTLTLVPQSLGVITNQVYVVSDYPDPSSADNSAVLTTRVLPPALLSIRPSSTNSVRVSWPSVFTDYTLQYRPTANSEGFWSNVVDPPSVLGNENVVNERATNAIKFYRLKK